jgi:hypothetical protein
MVTQNQAANLGGRYMRAQLLFMCASITCALMCVGVVGLYQAGIYSTEALVFYVDSFFILSVACFIGAIISHILARWRRNAG